MSRVVRKPVLSFRTDQTRSGLCSHRLRILEVIWVVLADSFRPGSFCSIFGLGRFSLGRWKVLADCWGELFRSWVVPAIVFRNY